MFVWLFLGNPEDGNSNDLLIQFPIAPQSNSCVLLPLWTQEKVFSFVLQVAILLDNILKFFFTISQNLIKGHYLTLMYLFIKPYSLLS